MHGQLYCIVEIVNHVKSPYSPKLLRVAEAWKPPATLMWMLVM
jgi:hypothetical protein